MTCNGCGNREAIRTITTSRGETCEACGGHGTGLGKEKKTGFMFGGKVLKKNSNIKIARKVRHDYLGDNSDGEVLGE